MSHLLKITTSYLSFLLFLKILLRLNVKNFRESYVFHCLVIKVVCLSTAFLFYHVVFSLSITFFKILQHLFSSIAFRFYHISFALSRTFSSFSNFLIFSIFLFFFKSIGSAILSVLFQRLGYYTMLSVICQQLSLFFWKSFKIIYFSETIISDSSTNITPKVHPVNS